jgi:two-component system sensor histidine kinase/response regulator
MSESIKALLVDDTPDNLVALEAMLRRDGLELLTARSGSEALELLLVHEVAIALLDVQMPEMDGFELAELMRGAARTRHVPIIFLTAGSRDPRRVFKGYESGAVDFLYKPIELHVLRSKVDVFFELARKRQELANALRLNEMFVAILGHDLRNPLNALSAGTALLQRQLDDPKQQRTLQRMESASQRMTDMIEQLLDLTRGRLADGVGFLRVRKPIEVGALVRQAIDELAATHPEREVVFEAEGDGSTAGDPERLLQLFSNLVGNALGHGERSGIVSVRVTGDAQDVVVAIRNRGVIPSETLPTIFEPFRSRPQSSSARGLGLGLYISQQIALAHDGEIRVASTPSDGTVFTVRLPKRDPG